MTYSAANLACFVCYLASFCGWGYLACGPGGRKGWIPAVGIACCAVVATLGFEAGLSAAAAGRVVFAGAGAGGLLWFSRNAGRLRSLPFGAAAIPAAAALLILVPMVVGGAQFALFQGNINDQFNYLASAVVRTTEGHRAIAAATPADFLHLSLLSIAHTMSGARPAVGDLYAGFEGILPGNLHRCAYGFLCALLMGSFFSVAEFIRCLCGAPRWRAQIVACAFVCGFWGQLQIDLDAWSWVAATPLVAAALGALVGTAIFRTPSEGIPPGSRVGLTLALCTAGQLYLYPEMFVFLAPSVIAALALRAVLLRQGPSELAASLLGPALVALAIAAPEIVSVARFAAHQVSFSSKADFTPLAWMWEAISGGPLAGAGVAGGTLRVLAGACGLSWLAGTQATRLPAILVAVAALASVGVALGKPGSARAPLGFASLVVCILAAQIAACFALGYTWVGAKGVSYASVLVVPLLLVPASSGRLEAWRAPAWMLLGLQLAFAFFRPGAAANPDGIHYHIPYYPSVMDPALKVARSWEVGLGPQLLAGSRSVRIDVPDVWLETYAAICVQSQGVPYSKGLPVYTYLGISEENYGTQAPAVNPDGLVYLDQDRITGRSGLGFAARDGRILSSRPGPRITRILSATRLDTMNGLLALRMNPLGDAATARMEYDRATPGATDLELGFIAQESARGALRLEVRTEEGTCASVAVAGLGLNVIQGQRIPLRIRSGRGEIQLVLAATADRTASDPMITIVNPHLMQNGGKK